MADLRTTYLGLNPKKPVLASSCGITGTVKGVKQCAQAGAGAVVLESLFEEEILAQVGGDGGAGGSAFAEEAGRWLEETVRRQGPRKYLELIRTVRQEIDTPVIASLNGVSGRNWVEYATQIEAAGADALELNVALMPLSVKESSEDMEEHLYSIVRSVGRHTRLPLAVKIGPWYTSLPRVVQGLVDAGACGVVLFNRFYQFDIDPATLKPVAGNPYSSSSDLSLPLRWTAIIAPQVSCELSLSTGVHSGQDAAKALVAGARVVQVASAMYRNRVGHLGTIAAELDQWLDSHGYAAARDACGQLSRGGTHKPEELQRLQYMRALRTDAET